jgi:UDP-MurNAc hydroxylase
VEHWEQLGAVAVELIPAEPLATLAEVEAAVLKHRKSVGANLLFLPWLLEAIGLIGPLDIRLPDIGATIRASYIGGFTALAADAPCDISMTAASAVFLFSNEYGFNTTHVNGRFRTADPGALKRFTRFFMPQNLGRQGYGVQHPLATIGYLIGNVAGRVGRRTQAG